MSKRLSYVTAVFGLCLSNVYCDGGDSETFAAPEVSAIEAVEIQPAEFTLTSAPEEQLSTRYYCTCCSSCHRTAVFSLYRKS